MAIEAMVPVADGIKYLSDLVKTVKDAEIKIPINNAILGLQEQLFQLREENSKLKEEVKQLKDTKEFEGRMERKGALIILDGTAYCGVCFGSSKEWIPMNIIEPNEYLCVKCGLSTPIKRASNMGA